MPSPCLDCWSPSATPQVPDPVGVGDDRRHRRVCAIAAAPGTGVIGWLLLAYVICSSIGGVGAAWATLAIVQAPGSLPGGREAAWLADLTWWLPLTFLSPLILLFLTDGRPADAGGRWHGRHGPVSG